MTTLPKIASRGTGPKSRLSSAAARLSPRTKYSPVGTVTALKGAVRMLSTANPLTKTLPLRATTWSPGTPTMRRTTTSWRACAFGTIVPAGDRSAWKATSSPRRGLRMR